MTTPPTPPSTGSAPAAGAARDPLATMVCFDVYSATRDLSGVYRPMLDELGLTYPQYLVMQLLWAHDPRSVRDLVRELRLDYGTLSPLLKRLEGAGLVRRERRPEDERSVLVTLTDDGRALHSRAGGVGDAIGAATGLTSDELVQLQHLLRKLSDSARTASG